MSRLAYIVAETDFRVNSKSETWTVAGERISQLKVEETKKGRRSPNRQAPKEASV